MENKSLDRTERASVIKEVKAKLERSCRFEDDDDDEEEGGGGGGGEEHTGNCWLCHFLDRTV